MPNIEIIGAHDPQEITDLVCKVMEELGLAKRAMTTVIQAEVLSCETPKQSMPYVRICDTDKERAEKIVAALKKARARIDTEVLLLHSFTPGIKMQ